LAIKLFGVVGTGCKGKKSPKLLYTLGGWFKMFTMSWQRVERNNIAKDIFQFLPLCAWPLTGCLHFSKYWEEKAAKGSCKNEKCPKHFSFWVVKQMGTHTKKSHFSECRSGPKRETFNSRKKIEMISLFGYIWVALEVCLH
jgi:hypothetical protein